MKLKSTLLAVCGLLFATSFAQHWDIEQVDSAGWGAGVHARRGPDGRLCLGYYNEQTGQIRVASRDSGVWHFESPAIPTVYLEDSRPFSFDVGPHGEVGVVYATSGSQMIFAQRSDTGWTRDSFAQGYGPCLAFDTSGAPNVVFGAWSLLFAVRTGTFWVIDTLAVGGGTMNYFYSCWRLKADPGNGLHAFCEDGWSWPSAHRLAADVFGGDIFVTARADSGWHMSWGTGGVAWGFDCLSMDLDTMGREEFCYQVHASPGQGFYLDSSLIDDGVRAARISVDRLNRCHIAYVNDGFKYRWLDGGWHVTTILRDTSVDIGDVLFDSAGQPIVSYYRPGNGVWLAHGMDIVGLSEGRQEPAAHGWQLAASDIRNVLWLAANGGGRAASGGLLDATGRRVLALKAGANDVSRLPAGIYFMRTQDPEHRTQSWGVRKVIVTR